MIVLLRRVILNGVWIIMSDITYTYHYISPLGSITLAINGEALTGLCFDGQKKLPHNLISESSEAELSHSQLSSCYRIYVDPDTRLHDNIIA